MAILKTFLPTLFLAMAVLSPADCTSHLRGLQVVSIMACEIRGMVHKNCGGLKDICGLESQNGSSGTVTTAMPTVASPSQSGDKVGQPEWRGSQQAYLARHHDQTAPAAQPVLGSSTQVHASRSS